MKKFYISKFGSSSGISKYSSDFYQFVLKPRGYHLVDSSLPLSDILTLISSNDQVHLELGIFQKKEIEILFSMVRGNYKNVTITLHDAPLIKYPYFEFKNPFMNFLSKLYDQSGLNISKPAKLLAKLKSIYVLTKKGQRILSKKYKLSNTHYLPHILNPNELANPTNTPQNLLYFGFIGKNKGIEYALKLHSKLIQTNPQCEFFVVGKALGKQEQYYAHLQESYLKNVHYLGYLPEKEVDLIYNKCGFAILPFSNYRFYYPFSGSILHSLKKGSIVFTKKNNAIAEIIQENVTGFFLSGKIYDDLRKLKEAMSNKTTINTIKQQSRHFLMENFIPEVVNKAFNE